MLAVNQWFIEDSPAHLVPVKATSVSSPTGRLPGMSMSIRQHDSLDRARVEEARSVTGRRLHFPWAKTGSALRRCGPVNRPVVLQGVDSVGRNGDDANRVQPPPSNAAPWHGLLGAPDVQRDPTGTP